MQTVYVITQDRGVAGEWYMGVTGRWTKLLADALFLDEECAAVYFNAGEHGLRKFILPENKLCPIPADK